MTDKTVKLEITYQSFPFDLRITSNLDVKTDYVLGILFDQIHILENTNAEVIHFIEERDLLNTSIDVKGKEIPEPIYIVIEKDFDTLAEDFAGRPTFIADRDVRTYTLIGILERTKYMLLADYETTILEADQTYGWNAEDSEEEE